MSLSRRQALGWAAGVPLAAPAAFANDKLARSSSPTVLSDRLFGESVGLQVKFAQGEPVTGLFTLRDLNIRWVRDLDFWPEFEPKAGHYRGFSGPMQQRLRHYKRNGIGIVYLLGMENREAYPDSPAKPLHSIDPEAFGRYAGAIVKELQRIGVEFVLEVWNEPHNSEMAKRVGGQWQGAAPSPWVDHYVRMVRNARDNVRAIDPSIKVFSQDDMWIVHYWFLEAGLPVDITGFTIHPYQRKPEFAAVAHDTDWCRPFQVVDTDASFRSGVRRLKEQGLKRLGRHPDIWITEVGWQLPQPGNPHGIEERLIAAYLPRTYIGAFAAGVEVTCWFSSMDIADGPFGLRDNRGDARMQLHTFITMQTELRRRRLLAQVAGETNLTAGLQAYLFEETDSGDQRLVLWTADDQERRVTLPSEARVVDARGKALAPVEGMGATWPVAASPIYARGRWSPATLREHFARATA